MNNYTIKPNTGETVKGTVCVFFEAEATDFYGQSADKVNPTGKIVKHYLPNAFLGKEMTCEEIQNAFFDAKGGSHHPRFMNCKITHVQKYKR